MFYYLILVVLSIWLEIDNLREAMGWSSFEEFASKYPYWTDEKVICIKGKQVYNSKCRLA